MSSEADMKRRRNKNQSPSNTAGDSGESHEGEHSKKPRTQSQAGDGGSGESSLEGGHSENLGAQPHARAEDDTDPPSAAAAALQGKIGAMGKQDMASSMDYSDHEEDMEASMFNIMKTGHVPGGSHQVTHSRAQQEQDGPVTSSQTPQTGTQHQQQQQQQHQQPQTGAQHQQQQQQPQTGAQHQQQQQQQSQQQPQQPQQQQQQQDPLKSAEGSKAPGPQADTEDGGLSSSSSIENIPDEGGSGTVDQDVPATTNPPIHSMVTTTTADASNAASGTPQSSNFKIKEVFGKYMLEVGPNKTVQFPKTFKSGKNIDLDKNYLKDEKGKVFQIKENSAGKIVITAVEKAESGDDEDSGSAPTSLTVEQPSLTASQRDKRGGQSRLNRGDQARPNSRHHSVEDPLRGDKDRHTADPPHGATGGDPQDNSDIDDADIHGFENKLDSDENDEKPGDEVDESYDMLPEAEQLKTKNRADSRDDPLADDQYQGKDTGNRTKPAAPLPEKDTIKSLFPETLQGTDTRQESPGDQSEPQAPPRRQKKKAEGAQKDAGSQEGASSADQPREERWSSLVYKKTTGADAQAETYKVEVLLREANGKTDSLTLLCQEDLYLKMQFMFKYPGDFAGKINRQAGQDGFIVQIENGALSILKKQAGVEDKFCIRVAVENVLQCTGNLSTNSFPKGGLDPEKLLDQLQQCASSASLPMYVCRDDGNEYLLCVYQDECAKAAEECRSKAVSDLRLQTDSCECAIIFAEVFRDEFEDVLKRRYPGVTVNMKEDDTKHTVILTFRGKGAEKEDAKTMWRQHTEKYGVNTFSFGSIKLGDQFDNLSDLLEHELASEKQTLEEKQDHKVYFYINDDAQKVIICTDIQATTDQLSNKIKRLIVTKEIIVPTDIDVEECQRKIINLLNKKKDQIQSNQFKEGKINLSGSRHEVELIMKEIDASIAEMRAIQRAKKKPPTVIEKMEAEWQFPHGHLLKVSNLPVDELQGDLLVTLLPEDQSAAVEALLEIQRKSPDSRVKITNLVVPTIGGKAKHTIATNINKLMELAAMEDCFNIVIVVVHKLSGWSVGKMIKSIVSPIKEYFEENQSHPVVTTFACSSTSVYNECSKIWDDGKQDHDSEQKEEEEDMDESDGNSTPKGLSVENMVEVRTVALLECKTDVIVNSVDKSLKLGMGHVSTAILAAAGPEIQAEVNQKCPEGIQFWQIVESRGYEIPHCQMVLHGALDWYSSTKPTKSLQDLEKFVYTCLAIADKRNFKSIAIPALGTGNLRYPKPKVARVMFEAVQKFLDDPKRQGSLQKVVFVLYSRDQDTVKSFENEQSKYVGVQGQAEASTGDRGDPSERLTIGNLQLQASHGRLGDTRADVLIYLWQKDHMDYVKVNKHPLLKKLPGDIRSAWTNARDNAKKRNYEQFTSGGGDFADEIVHMPCDSCNSVSKNFRDALILAEDSGKKHVVVYFNEANPLSGSSALPDQVVQAVYNYVAMKDHRITDVTILADYERLYNNFKRQFAHQQKNDPATARPTPALIEPSDQAISQSDRGAGATGKEKATTPKMTTQWDSSKFQSPGLEKYVVVKNIPKGYTEEKFKATLLTPDFPVRPPSVAYSKTMAEAVLICRDETEPTQLLTWTFADGMTASIPSQSLQSLEAVIPEVTPKKLKKNESCTKLVAELARQDIHIAAKNGKLMISAPTLCQVNYGQDRIAVCLGIPSKPDPDMSSFENVTGEAMPENNYKIFKMLRRDEICAFEKQGGIVSFDGGQLMFTIPLTINIPQDLTNFAKEISSQQADDIDIEEKWLAKADDWCLDLTDPANKTWCIYEVDQHKIIACCKSYDDLQKVKHRLNVLQEKVKITGRRQRHIGTAEAAAPHQPPMFEKGSDDAAPNLARAGKFQWSKDTSNLQGYKTDEGIEVFVYNASIVKLPVDCIVNAANEMLQHGGGVAKVIEDAAGPALTRESDDYIRQNGNIPVGMCCSTTAGRLLFKKVIHTVGPRWYDFHPHTLQKVQDCEDKLYMAIMQTLCTAEKEGMQSVALPAISSAIFGVPEEMCTYQYAKATMDYSKSCKKAKQGQNTLKEVHFVDINVNIIQQIQKRFDAFVKEGNAPSYDINKFVKRTDFGRSQRGERTSYSGVVQTSKSHGVVPTSKSTFYDHQPVILESEKHGKRCFNVGENNELVIYSNDIFNSRTDAVVCVINIHGDPASRIASLIYKKKIYGQNKQYYDQERKSQYGRLKPGQVVMTGGWGCGFKHILHVVFPADMDSSYKMKKEKREVLKEGFTNILKCCQNKDVRSIALSHLGTDHDLSAEVFLEVYLSFGMNKLSRGRRLQVDFVCYETIASEIIYNKFHNCAKTQNENYDTESQGEKQADITTPERLYPALPSTSNRTEDKTEVLEEHVYQAQKDTAKIDAAENGTAEKDSAEKGAEEKESCVICMDDITDPETLPCGHKFCRDCIEQQTKYKPACPSCFKPFGIIKGDQPDGTMRDDVDRYRRCAGYDHCGTIVIQYRFPSGIQKDNHPKPGMRYDGIQRNAYLPDNREGNIVLEMLKVAWSRRLVFTIGTSRMTGQEGVITWNDIHHKTNMKPHEKFGYPDAEYLQRVTEELGAKGVKEEDIPEDRWRDIRRRFPNRR